MHVVMAVSRGMTGKGGGGREIMPCSIKNSRTTCASFYWFCLPVVYARVSRTQPKSERNIFIFSLLGDDGNGDDETFAPVCQPKSIRGSDTTIRQQMNVK